MTNNSISISEFINSRTDDASSSSFYVDDMDASERGKSQSGSSESGGQSESPDAIVQKLAESENAYMNVGKTVVFLLIIAMGALVSAGIFIYLDGEEETDFTEAFELFAQNAGDATSLHVDSIFVGQPASLRFTAFDQRQTPEIFGQVADVSADVFQDEVTGLNYYRVELLPQEGELAKLNDQVLLPGMPVEAFLKTADRTPLSYLTKPMTDYFGRAMREG